MRKLFVGIICMMVFAACQNEAEKTTPPVTTVDSTKTPPPIAFADQKYIDMGKKAWELFAGGDIDGWASGFADNAIFRWSAGDSLTGKAAIVKYWKDRRMNVIDSLQFNNGIWLPVTVNQPQSVETKGTWLLIWYMVTARYKNKQTLTFWVHTDMHYNNDNMVDEIIQYIDRAPINAALGRK